MTAAVALAPARCATQIQQEIDRSRRSGPLQNIVVPPCPALLAQLQAAMAKPEPDLLQVAHIAGSDVAMSAALIRRANGALHAGKQPVHTVGQAMDRLGLFETASTMTAFLARSAVHCDARHLGRFWDMSSKRAAAMSMLATRLPGVSADMAHTCGLFLHVGQPVLLQSVRGYAGTLVEGAARKDRSFIQTENANHRTDHAVVGALVARVWHLAPPVMSAIRLHHDMDALRDESIEPEVRTLMATALVGDHLVRTYEREAPSPEWVAHGHDALVWLDGDETQLNEWADHVHAAISAV